MNIKQVSNSFAGPTIKSPPPFTKNSNADPLKVPDENTSLPLDCFALNTYQNSCALALGELHEMTIDLLVPSGPNQSFLIGNNPSHAIQLPYSSEIPVLFGEIYYQQKTPKIKISGMAIRAHVSDMISVNGRLLEKGGWSLVDEGTTILIDEELKFNLRLVDPREAPTIRLAKGIPSTMLLHTHTGTKFNAAPSKSAGYVVQDIFSGTIGGRFSFDYGVPILLRASPQAQIQYNEKTKAFQLIIERGIVPKNRGAQITPESFTLSPGDLITLGGVQLAFIPEGVQIEMTKTIVVGPEYSQIIPGPVDMRNVQVVNAQGRGSHYQLEGALSTQMAKMRGVVPSTGTTQLSLDDTNVTVLSEQDQGVTKIHAPDPTVMLSLEDAVYPIITEAIPFSDLGLGRGVIPNEKSPKAEILGYLQIISKKKGDESLGLGTLPIVATSDNKFTLGRPKNNEGEVVQQLGNSLLVNRKYISREHAEIVINPDGSAKMTDLGAKNSIRINGGGPPLSNKLSTKLPDGQVFTIAGEDESLIFRFRIVHPKNRRALLK